jgi:hypothetical protein
MLFPGQAYALNRDLSFCFSLCKNLPKTSMNRTVRAFNTENISGGMTLKPCRPLADSIHHNGNLRTGELVQNPVGFGQALGKPVENPVFPLNSR